MHNHCLLCPLVLFCCSESLGLHVLISHLRRNSMSEHDHARELCAATFLIMNSGSYSNTLVCKYLYSIEAASDSSDVSDIHASFQTCESRLSAKSRSGLMASKFPCCWMYALASHIYKSGCMSRWMLTSQTFTSAKADKDMLFSPDVPDHLMQRYASADWCFFLCSAVDRKMFHKLCVWSCRQLCKAATPLLVTQ